MRRLEELYDNMLDEAPFNFKEGNKPYIFELAKIYAEECVKASLEKASEKATVFEVDWDTNIVNKESITNESNIVLL